MRSSSQTSKRPMCNVSIFLLLFVTYSSVLPAAVSANYHHGASSSNNPPPTNTLPRSSPSIPRTDPQSTEARRRQQQQQRSNTSLSSSSSSSSDSSSSSSSLDAPSSFSDAASLPWNPSPHIDADGFLRPWYFRIPGEWEAPELILSLPEYQQLLDETARVRRAPGHGGTTQQRPPKLIRGPGGWLESGGGSRSSRNSSPRTHSTTSPSPSPPDSSSSSAYHNYHQLCTVPVRIRQVPGDGNCLFHSISLCLRHAVNGTHWNMRTTTTTTTTSHDEAEESAAAALDDLYQHSRWLRQQAVQCLRQSHRRLVLQGRETLKAHELVHAAAQQYALTTEEYCAAMEQEFVWGGGPEIVALSNCLQRPIHVYELAVADRTAIAQSGDMRKLAHPTFVLRRMACFGSPRFDRRTPLHILSADSRFPDLLPGEQLPAGNHFLAVFPHESVRAALRNKRHRRRGLRGGAENRGFEYQDDDDDDDDVDGNSDDNHTPDAEEGDGGLFRFRRQKNVELDDDDSADEQRQQIPRWMQWWRNIMADEEGDGEY